ncbi:glycoside hydrolase superfamily [Tribonema minus]|uniref:Glycoside hydrolase superfamily n=1 Tax=Tribonema minus TaxID=303371 RepID=A0A835ZCD2_9STRA|nr:glycoside hydrolase superfamily [Tribonema minus]
MLSPSRRRVLSGDPYCSSGKLYGAGICCSEACAACGTQNDGCASDAAGEGSCCADVITASELSCNQYGPPCIIDEERFAEPSTPADPWSIHRNSVVGVLTGPDKTVAEREAQYGMTFDAELIYQNVLYLNFTYLQDVMESGKKVQLVIEINDNLANIASGTYDTQLYNFGLEAAAYGRKISTRILHEINGDWYPWCAFAPGNSIDQFYEAFVRVVNALRGSGADLKIQLAYAAQNAAGYDNPFIDFFEPIKDYVDEVCVSAYNLCGDKYSENKPLRDIMGEWYKQVTWFTDLPICIAEMSSTGHCEGKPAWIADAWDTITNEFTQVRTINWFFENKIDLLNRDYDLNTSSDVQQFVDGFNNFKYATSRVRQ